MSQKKKRLKDVFKIPLKVKRKLEKIKIFEIYVIHKKKELHENKYIFFD